MVLLKNAFPWIGWPFYASANVTKGRVGLSEVSQKDLQLIRETNKLDIELYEFAKELFDAEVRESNHIDQALKSFQRWNSFYQRAIAPALTLRSSILKKGLGS